MSRDPLQSLAAAARGPEVGPEMAEETLFAVALLAAEEAAEVFVKVLGHVLSGPAGVFLLLRIFIAILDGKGIFFVNAAAAASFEILLGLHDFRESHYNLSLIHI